MIFICSGLLAVVMSMTHSAINVECSHSNMRNLCVCFAEQCRKEWPEQGDRNGTITNESCGQEGHW